MTGVSWKREIAWNALFYRVVINSVSSRESTCNIAACIATSSFSSPGYYAPPLSTPLIPRRRHERSTAPPLPLSSMPSVFLDIKGGMPTVSQSPRHAYLIFGTPKPAILGPDLLNILRQSYDYLTIMPQLRSTYDGRLIYQTSEEGRKGFLGYSSVAKS